MNHAQLTALGRALRLLGEHGDALNADTPDARLHEVKDDIKRALELLDETVTSAKPTTRCAEHPNGPVDEEAPDRCLLCETRRRTARREAELFLTAQRRGPRPAIAYRLVQEFTDYDVTRIWGEPVRMDIEPMGNV
ncbi:hypothetical protein [Streptomyces scabiei]|uniref:hypothetical protein n=1 Tax=Streptomyces scabiei TaxID=1930 RepID=UPI0029A00798|nr:hypothetical protein [Streptomyces scabiei]MDX3482142.1 hypothetical protein [Streptomyces scabiei]